jgi:AcrR family transcriptional regulator
MSDVTGTGLPASIEAVWGLVPPPTKGPKRGLSLDRIIEAGIAVAASDGLAAVSMSRVAAQLGTSAMTLYRYVASKDELLTLMADRAIGDPLPVPQNVRGWRGGLEHWAWSLLAAYRQHSWTLRVPITGPPVAPHAVAWMEQALGCMAGTNLDEAEKMSVLLLLSGLVRNDATLGADLAAAFEANQTTPDDVMLDYGRTLRRLIGSDGFPALRTVVEAGVFDLADDPDSDFSFNLDRVLDGIESLMRSRASR